MPSSDEYAGCVWPVDETCLPTLPEESSDEGYQSAAASLEAAQVLAVQVLWALSGRQYGVCPAIVRPCPQSYPPRYYGRRPLPSSYEIFSWADYGWALTGCGCGGRCTVTGPGMVHLPGPVAEIVAVTINGVEIDPTEYAVEGDVLYRIGSSSAWPSQDMSRPATEPGTWQVEYLRGIEPPAGAAKLVSLLTTEFYNACTGGRCRLPRTVTEVTRQGVTHRIANPNDIYATGKTGIPEIDLWLAAVNPHHLLQAPSVL